MKTDHSPAKALEKVMEELAGGLCRVCDAAFLAGFAAGANYGVDYGDLAYSEARVEQAFNSWMVSSS